jgi:hypothetical protein
LCKAVCGLHCAFGEGFLNASLGYSGSLLVRMLSGSSLFSGMLTSVQNGHGDSILCAVASPSVLVNSHIPDCFQFGNALCVPSVLVYSSKYVYQFICCFPTG